MKYLIKPITKKMVTKMQTARAIELSENGTGICDLKVFHGCLSGLYKRGLVDTKRVTVNGKDIVGVFITQSGIDLLKRYEEDEKIFTTLKKTG